MRILVACEMSGRVREAFRYKGHEAFSIDLVDSLDGSPYHTKDDVLKWLHQDWDMLIGFPPCTNLAVSGASHFKRKREDGSQQKSIDFFMSLANAPIERICIENPVGIMSSIWRKPDQIVQPYWFGHPESKKTCLWLKNLPPLQPTNMLPKPDCGYWENQTPSGQNKLGPSKDRAMIRSLTYKGISEAMANQWNFK